MVPLGLPTWTYRYFFEIDYIKGGKYGEIKFEIDYNWVAFEDDVLLFTPYDKYVEDGIEIILPSACRERELTERLLSANVVIEKARIQYKQFVHEATEEERVMARNKELYSLAKRLAARSAVMRHCKVCTERLKSYEKD